MPAECGAMAISVGAPLTCMPWWGPVGMDWPWTLMGGCGPALARERLAREGEDQHW